MTLTVGDLPAPRPNQTLPQGGTIMTKQPMLYCPSCGDESSANPGDYWAANPHTKLTCGDCDEPLQLVESCTVHIPVGQVAAFWKMVQVLKGVGDEL